jgi:hypothetical protein
MSTVPPLPDGSASTAAGPGEVSKQSSLKAGSLTCGCDTERGSTNAQSGINDPGP